MIGALITAFLPLVVVIVGRIVGRLRLHRRRRANRRFMARYRADHPQVCQVTVEAAPVGALPVIRRRTPAGAHRAPSQAHAPAGPDSSRAAGRE